MGLRMTLFQLNQNSLEDIIENPKNLFEINYSQEKYNSLDIDKFWDGLKFILSEVETNNSNELSKLISSKQEIEGLEEFDIYDVNFLTNQQVKSLTTELSNFTESDLKEKFDFSSMNENDIYGNPFDQKSFLFFVENFRKLKWFYQNAMSKRKAVISFIS